MLLQLFSIMLCACALLNVVWQENEGQKWYYDLQPLASLRPQKEVTTLPLKEPPRFSILELIVKLNTSAKQLLCKISIISLNLTFFSEQQK